MKAAVVVLALLLAIAAKLWQARRCSRAPCRRGRDIAWFD